MSGAVGSGGLARLGMPAMNAMRHRAQQQPAAAISAGQVAAGIDTIDPNAASLLADQVDTEEERAYLRALAGKLGLQPAVVGQMHGALGVPAVT